jgi:hypothetical protein
MVSVSLVRSRNKSSSSLLSKARKDSEILETAGFFLAGVSSVKSTHVSLEPGDEVETPYCWCWWYADDVFCCCQLILLQSEVFVIIIIIVVQNAAS